MPSLKNEPRTNYDQNFNLLRLCSICRLSFVDVLSLPLEKQFSLAAWLWCLKKIEMNKINILFRIYDNFLSIF